MGRATQRGRREDPLPRPLSPIRSTAKCCPVPFSTTQYAFYFHLGRSHTQLLLNVMVSIKPIPLLQLFWNGLGMVRSTLNFLKLKVKAEFPGKSLCFWAACSKTQGVSRNEKGLQSHFYVIDCSQKCFPIVYSMHILGTYSSITSSRFIRQCCPNNTVLGTLRYIQTPTLKC